MRHLIKNIEHYMFAIALFIIGMSVAMGAWWGLVGEWNPDQLAFGNLDTRYIIPKPYSYLRPPLVSYFHLYFSEIPIRGIGVAIHAPDALIAYSTLFWSKLLAAGIYVLSVFLFYRMIKKWTNKAIYARLFAIIFGSSAGLIAYGHFLTADIPLMCFMICTLLFIVRAHLRPSLKYFSIAGIMCGITAAVKYNGLILASPLVLVCFLSSAKSFMVRIQRILVVVVSVAIGFLLGNPYTLFDFDHMYRNFLYLIQTTKYYGGENLSIGYGLILPGIRDLIGRPATILVGVMIFLSFVSLIFSKKIRDTLLPFVVINLSILLPYMLFIGHSSFLPARYLLPIIPSLFFLALPALYIAAYKQWTTYPAFIIALSLISYNFLCVYEIDKRFVFDPRMSAYTWSYKNIPDGSKIETTHYTPDINRAFNKHVVITTIPYVKERSISFTKLFASNKEILQQIDQFEGGQDDEWFTVENLYKRNPDYILVNSWQYGGMFPSYPIAKDYYRKLLNGETKYRIVFDQETPQMPRWSYPQDVDFLFNRMVILQNTDNDR